ALQDRVSADVTAGLAGDRWHLSCLAEWAAGVRQSGTGLLHPRHPQPHGFLGLVRAAGRHLLGGARRGLVQHQELLAHRRHLLTHTSGAPTLATPGLTLY